MQRRNTRIILASALCAALLAANAPAEDEPTEAARADAIPDLDCVIDPSEIVDVGSAVAGVIETVHADRGDPVQEGTVLAELDADVERATLTLSMARAELTTAIELRQESAAFERRTWERNEALYQQSTISAQDIDRLKTETRIAQFQVRQEEDNQRIAELEYRRAEAALNRRTIRSPVEGVVMDRFKSAGEYVENDPVLRIAKLDPLHVEVIVPVEHLGRVKPGMRAEVTPVVPGHGRHVATVTRIDPVADAASGTFGVRLSLANPDYAIAGGLRCRLGFLQAEEASAPPMATKPPRRKSVAAAAALDAAAETPAPARSVGAAVPTEPVKHPRAAIATVARAAMPGERVASGVGAGRVAGAPGLAAPVILKADAVRDDGSARAPTTATAADASGEVVPATATTEPGPGGCYTVGPLPGEALARRLAGALSGKTDEPIVRKEYGSAPSEYQILAAKPPDSATRAFVSELGAAGIEDFFLLTHGDHRGRVSLGLYRVLSYALNRQTWLAARGIEAEVVPRHHGTPTYWLSLSLEDDPEAEPEIRNVVAATAPDAAVEQSSCGQLLAGR